MFESSVGEKTDRSLARMHNNAHSLDSVDGIVKKNTKSMPIYYFIYNSTVDGIIL